MTVQEQSFVQPVSSNIPVPTTITNVIATLQGTDPTSTAVYVVSAHYDDRVTDVLNFTDDAPGADRDGSGVTAMLELARVMATHPSKSTIEFVAFDGEEQGLYGSSFFAKEAHAAGQNIEGDLNMDIVGSPLGGNGANEPLIVSVYSEGIPTNATAGQIALMQSIGGENDGVSRQLARYIKETNQNGVTGMNVQLVFRRDPNPESDVAGYEVVWRSTTDNDWTNARLVGNVTSYTLTGINKDTNQFGVRAVDGQGNRSPVSYAMAGP